MESIKHQQVNWVDGMNINKSHLLGLENEITDHVRDARQNQVDALSYGLLPSAPGMDDPVDIWMNIDSQNRVSVHLNRCNAVTLGGVRIEITREIADQLKLSAHELRSVLQLDESANDDLLVILTCDPFSRIPVGDADPGETPPRKPYTLPNYSLDLVPAKNMGIGEVGLYHLVVGKIEVNSGKAVLQDSYIPPSSSARSHPFLMEAHERQVRFLSELEFNCIQIIQKVYTKQIKNGLAQIITVICRALIQYTSHQSTVFEQVVPYRSPVFMVTHTAAMARIIKNEITLRAGIGAEQLLTYLAEWCGLNQAEFEKDLDAMIGHDYQHYDIRRSIEAIDSFMGIVSSLFQKLAELDYIGKKSKTNIFVKEEAVNAEPKEEKATWRGRFLAE